MQIILDDQMTVDSSLPTIQALARLEEAVAGINAKLDKLLTGPPIQKRWWTVDELAEAMGRAPFTVREKCRHGIIKAQKDPYQRAWKIPAEEAERLIAGDTW